MIQLGEFSNCIEFINKQKDDSFLFENLYCLYREKKYAEAEKMISSKNLSEDKLKILYAQIVLLLKPLFFLFKKVL